MVVALHKIKAANLFYYIHPINETKCNLFFGKKECIQMVQEFCNKPLNELSIEEDFMLGTILGYGVEEQCQRYMKRRKALEYRMMD